MQYKQYIFNTPDAETAEMLAALLADEGFSMFQQEENMLNAYIDTESLANFDWKTFSAQLQWLSQFNPEIKDCENRNWNELWESNFQPIVIENEIGVRSSRHSALHLPLEIIIDPKMSFGTGHHATTYMMLLAMRLISFAGKRVFDYGCGTGILSIAAEKLGAEQVTAIDIDDWCMQNAAECIEMNNCKTIELHKGDVDIVANRTFDIVLANINRNTIQQQFSVLYGLCAPGARMLISGFLTQDEADMQRMASTLNLAVESRYEKNEWVCLQLKKK